jgi:formylglycine-generating enzyme required for sulfatase activity
MCEPPKAWFAALMQDNLPLAGRLCAAAQLAGQPWAGTYKADVAKALLALQSSQEPLPLRLDAGLALGLVGDDIRYEQPWAGAPCILPKAEFWIPVAAQKGYVLGSSEDDEDAFSWELNAKPVDIESFHIAFASVTNAEFARFVDDGGYTTDTWWCKDGMQWRKGQTAGYGQLIAIRDFRRECLKRGAQNALDEFFNPQKQQPEAWAALVVECVTNFPEGQDAAFDVYLNQKFAPTGNAFTAPLFWQNASFNQAMQPVVGICVYEAEAYVRWLNSKRQDQSHGYALPTEAQWELAARGAEKRSWPWRPEARLAAADISGTHMNFAATWSLATTPVGLFAQSNTPDGCVDMAGNVWEWTASQAQVNEGGALKDYEFGNPHQPVNGGAADLWRVVRGGSWSYGARFARPASRLRLTLVNRNLSLGFRLISRPMTLDSGL